MSAEQILSERDGHVATVTLNRPEKLNAMTKSMWLRLGEVIADLASDDAVRCIVLRGAGGKAFSPGNDISEFESERSNPAEAKAYGALMHRALGGLKDCRQPTVAAIQGICVGGGLEIAALCDLRICGRSSRFGAPINRLGLVMAHAELAALIDLVGKSAALEILLEGEVFGVERAERLGLVSRVVDDDEVLPEAYAAARRIADGAPLVARWHKQFARRLADPTPLSEAEIDEGYACYGTEDFRIGYRSFLEKKKPDFVGR